MSSKLKYSKCFPTYGSTRLTVVLFVEGLSHLHCISYLLMHNKFSSISQLKATHICYLIGSMSQNQVWCSWLLGFRVFHGTEIKIFRLKSSMRERSISKLMQLLAGFLLSCWMESLRSLLAASQWLLSIPCLGFTL